MAHRVFFHIAAPKTGTTYLQSIVWGNRKRLREAGLLLPSGRRDHWWATLVLREDPRLLEKPPTAAAAWDRIVADCTAWDGDALITNEFYGAATAAQARSAVAALGPAEVHLVVTARNPLDTFVSAWQELLRYRGIASPLAEFDLTRPADPLENWHWGNLDVSMVLSRWGDSVPADRVHVLPMPGRQFPRDELWRRFAALIGVDPDSCDLASSFGNTSMGPVEAEVLRRVNVHLAGALSGQERATWVRDYLCKELLVPRAGKQLDPPPHRLEECRARGRDMVDSIRRAGYDVIGDLDDLLVADDVPVPPPGSPAVAEVADAASEVIASMLVRMRELSEA